MDWEVSYAFRINEEKDVVEGMKGVTGLDRTSSEGNRRGN